MSRSATVKAKPENSIVRYFRETRAEISKVTWPTREEGMRLTGIVVVATILAGIFLFSTDYFFGAVIGFLIRL